MADVLFATLQVPGTAQLEFALAQQQGVHLVNTANSGESCALHVAVWRGGADAVQRLLDAGAAPDQQDGESGWTPLHKALYLGNIQAAAALLQAGASLDITDHKGRLPLDLLSAELKAQWQAEQGQLSRGHGSRTGGRLAERSCSHGGSIVFSWGNGANLQLGTGSTDLHLAPVRVDSLMHAGHVTALTAAKYHSAAVASDGSVYTWGWGRGGRLGHPEFFIHSGQAAQILPRRVDGLGQRKVVSIAAAKHHTLAATSSGELFSWGSNKDGRLGYATPDTQPVPRKVALLRSKIVVVAAANKHSAAVSASGEVFTWGANSHGQLGYGTSDSGSNPVPRVVESMKGRALVAVAAAKYHTVVLTAEGDVYQWGHKVVTPRYISLAGSRDIARAGPAPPATATPGASQAATSSNNTTSSGGGSSTGSMRFHRGQGEVSRPMAVAVAAGVAHTSCITRAGVVLAWRSDAGQGPVREVGGALAGKRAVQLSAGKYRTAVVTDAGDVFAWEAKDKQHKARQQQESGAQAEALPGAAAAATALAVAAAAASRGVAEASAAVAVAVTAAAAAGAATLTPATTRAQQHQQQQQQQEDDATQSIRGNCADAGSSSGCGTADAPIQPERVPGLRRATVVAVGEKHSLALQRWSAPALPSDHSSHLSMLAPLVQRQPVQLLLPAEGEAEDAGSDGGESLSPHAAGRSRHAKTDEWNVAADSMAGPGTIGSMSSRQTQPANRGPAVVGSGPHGYAEGTSSSWDGSSGSSSDDRVPRLQHICEHVVATELVEPRTTLRVLEYADVAGAQVLRSFCLAVALRNLDVVIQEARASVEATPAHLVKELERHYKAAVLGCAATAAAAAATAAATAAAAAAAPAKGAHSMAAAAPSTSSRQQQQQQQQQGQNTLAPAPQAPAHIFSTLQPGCRPTAAPVWFTADSHDHSSLPYYLPAATPQPAASTLGPAATTTAPADSDGGRFTTEGGSQAAAAHEAAQKLHRNVLKKLQQIAHLEERQQEGVALDAQQLAKANQKASLLEALHLLQLGGPSAHMQASALVAQAQATAAKLTSWAESAAAAASPVFGSTPTGLGDGLRQRSKTQLSRQSGSGGSGNADARSAELTDAGAAAAVSAAAEVKDGSTTAPSALAAADLASVQAQLAAAEASLGVAPDPAAIGKPAAASKTPKRTPSQSRKGDLSVFLRGALDKPQPPQPAAADPAAAVAPAVAAKPKGPAWGGAGLSQPPPQQPGASLREVLSQKSNSSSVSSMSKDATGGDTSMQPQGLATPGPGPSKAQPAAVRSASSGSATGPITQPGSCPSPSTPSTATAAATAGTSRSTATATSPGLPPAKQRTSTSTIISSSPAGLNSPTPPLPQARKGNSALHAALQRQALLPAVGKSPFATPPAKQGQGTPSPGHMPASQSTASEGSSSGINVSLFDLLNAKRAAPAAVLRPPAAAPATASASASASSADVAPTPAWGGVRGASPGSSSSSRPQQQGQQLQQQQQQQQRQVPESPQPKAQSLREIQAEQERLRSTTGFAALQRERAAAAGSSNTPGPTLHHSSSAGRSSSHAHGSSPQHASPLALMAAAGGISGALNGAGAGAERVLGTSPGSASWGMGSWGSFLPASSPPPVQSKWYVSEQPHMRSLADIQSEEVAAQQEAASKLLAQTLEEQERAKAAEAKRQAKAAQRAARKVKALKAAEAQKAQAPAGQPQQTPNGNSPVAGEGGSSKPADSTAAGAGSQPQRRAAAGKGGPRRDQPAVVAANSAADAAAGSAGGQDGRQRRSRQPSSSGKGAGSGARGAPAAAGASGAADVPASMQRPQHRTGFAGAAGADGGSGSLSRGVSPDVMLARDARGHSSRGRGVSSHSADGTGRGGGGSLRGGHAHGRGSGRGRGRQSEQQHEKQPDRQQQQHADIKPPASAPAGPM